MVARANEGFPWLSRRSGHCRNVSRTPVNIRANSGLTRSPGESFPESGINGKINIGTDRRNHDSEAICTGEVRCNL